MVSFASRLWLLVIWHRRQYPAHEPAISRSIRSSRRKRWSESFYYTPPHSSFKIDPNRTISAGKVDIGAFRTYPPSYTPPSASASEYQSIPLNKIEDFGVHANQYYSLDVQVFTSELDKELLGLLWNKYWVNTLSQSPLISVSIFLLLVRAAIF